MSNPVTILFFPKVNSDKTRFMPYSVMYLERMVRQFATEIVFIDEQTDNDYEKIIVEYAGRIKLAATTAATGFQIKGALEFSQAIKRVNPKASTLWAGWHCSLLPEQTLRNENIDFIINGQAEIPFKELATAILEGNPYEHIAGLGFKNERGIFVNPPAPFADIKAFPDINWDLINPDNYVFENSFSKRCITYFASHGCPFKCGFCSLATVFGGKWHHKAIDTVVKDISVLKERANIDAVSFWDDNFFTQKAFSMELAQVLIENNLDIKWECCTHAGLFNKLFNDGEIGFLYRAGLRQVFIGAESGDASILELVDKKISVADNFLIVKNFKKHAIKPVFLLIVCFPVNPEKDLAATFEMIRKAKLINSELKIRMHLFVPVPKTQMFDEAMQKGLIMPDKLEDYIDFLHRFDAPWLNKDIRWQLECFVNFYVPLANPGFYKEVPGLINKILAFVLNKTMYPFVFLRFRYNFFRLPLEAYFFLNILRFYNRISGKKITLGSESYLSKNKLGFYNSYCG